MSKEAEFWVSNISDLNVCLRDLCMTVKARANINLLDSRHYHFTPERLELSAKSGSLYAKRHLLKVRQVPPDELIKPGLYVSKEPLFLVNNPLLSKLVIEEPEYEELDISEEQFIDELTDEDDE